MLRPAIVMVCIVLAAGVAQAGETATDAKRGIRMAVPDGFRALPDDARPPGTLFAYGKGELGTPGFELLGVTPLGGTIGREDFDPTPMIQQMAQAQGLTVVSSGRRPVSWKGFQLDGFVATMKSGDQVASVAGVQVPVAGEAVQLMVMRVGEGDLSGQLQAVLAGFEAESSWLSTPERIWKLALGGGTLLVLVAIAVVARIRRHREKRAA